jgi:hypothetical protein
VRQFAPAVAILTLLASFAFAPASSGITGATARMPVLYKNCTNYNKRYPHGVGRLLARDKVRAGSEPVRNFRRSNRLFRVAMSWNKGLDRDKDNIACEKH